jgi:hypothetical protein
MELYCEKFINPDNFPSSPFFANCSFLTELRYKTGLGAVRNEHFLFERRGLLL